MWRWEFCILIMIHSFIGPAVKVDSVKLQFSTKCVSWDNCDLYLHVFIICCFNADYRKTPLGLTNTGVESIVSRLSSLSGSASSAHRMWRDNSFYDVLIFSWQKKKKTAKYMFHSFCECCCFVSAVWQSYLWIATRYNHDDGVKVSNYVEHWSFQAGFWVLCKGLDT